VLTPTALLLPSPLLHLHRLHMLCCCSCRLYGRALNVNDVGVSCNGDGCFYSKSATGFLTWDKPWLLSVQASVCQQQRLTGRVED
jgi:hypothetical protein